MPHTIRVWDLPTRLFHWLLAACVIGLVVSGKIGGAAIVWHARLGYAVLALLLFRVVWGFAGGHWSRFGSFLYGPSSVIGYLQDLRTSNGNPVYPGMQLPEGQKRFKGYPVLETTNFPLTLNTRGSNDDTRLRMPSPV